MQPEFEDWLTRVSAVANMVTSLALEWRVDDSPLTDALVHQLERRDPQLEYGIPAAAAVMEAALILRQVVVLGSEELATGRRDRV